MVQRCRLGWTIGQECAGKVNVLQCLSYITKKKTHFQHIRHRLFRIILILEIPVILKNILNHYSTKSKTWKVKILTKTSLQISHNTLPLACSYFFLSPFTILIYEKQIPFYSFVQLKPETYKENRINKRKEQQYILFCMH